jgi:hypothetical protein
MILKINYDLEKIKGYMDKKELLEFLIDKNIPFSLRS